MIDAIGLICLVQMYFNGPYMDAFFKKNGPNPASLSFIFGLFKQTSLQILQQIYVKSVHPVYGAGIWTHDLRDMSRLP